MTAYADLRALVADPRDNSSRAQDPHVLREHGPEPVRGLPEYLPAGERLLWQGTPSWRLLATRAFHLRVLAGYFVALGLYAALTAEAGPVEAALSGLWLAAIGLLPVGVIALFAWGTQRSTVYTLTERRLVMRIGVALPITVNLPLAAIAGAALRRHADGSGDVVLSLLPQHRIPWLFLWPHARPWRLARAEPALRALPDATAVAALLARALAADAGLAVPAFATTAPAPAARPDTVAA